MHAAIRLRVTRRLLVPAALLAAACGALAPPERPARERAVNFTVAGTVAVVEDGDTLTLVALNDARFVVRLSDLDTPEVSHRGGPDRGCPGRVLADRPGQPRGRAARASLESLASGRQVRAECYEIDRFGRPVCHVFAGDVNVNLAQIERGWGMLPDRADWVRDPASRPAEAQARARGAGAWAVPAPVHPAVWRERCWGQGDCPGAES